MRDDPGKNLKWLEHELLAAEQRPQFAPKPDEILSLYAILGRNVLTPDIFDKIEEGLKTNDTDHELYLTDIFSDMGAKGELMAYDFDGKRFDMGNKLGIMKANCEVALDHPEIGDGFKEYLKELVKTF